MRIPRTTALLTALALAELGLAQRTLEYRFAPGDRLVYELREFDEVAGKPPERRAVEQIQVWCLADRDGESFLLLDRIRVPEGAPAEPLRGALLYIDVRGVRRWPTESVARVPGVEPALLALPELPGAAAGETAWVTSIDLLGRRWSCRRAAENPGRDGAWPIEFSEEDTTGAADADGRRVDGRLWFDPVQRVVTRLERTESNPRAAAHKLLLVLRQRAQGDEVWAGRRAEEADRYLRALRHEDRILSEVMQHPQTIGDSLRTLDRHWDTFIGDLAAAGESPVRALAAARRRLLRLETPGLSARAELANRWLGRPAPPWTLQDAAGRTVRSETLRGRVTVECFWSGETPWGPRALASLRRARQLLRTGDVRFIGLNVDRDAPAARRAIELCGGGIPHVLADSLLLSDPLPETPVVRVLDEKSVVRGVWCGWEAEYAGLAELVQSLAN